MNNSTHIIIEPDNPQSLEFKLSEAGGVNFEQGDYYPFGGSPTNSRTALAQKGYTQRVLGDESKISPSDMKNYETDNRGNVWKKPWEKPQPVAPEVYQPDYAPAALPSDAPAWWADSASGGSVGGAQTPPQALPQFPITPPSPSGAGGTNPMVQLLSAKGGTTNVGESTPLANALRSASLAPQGGANG